MPVCPYCSSSDLTRDGHDQRGRAVRACRACGRHATSESASLLAGHRFPRDSILLAVRSCATQLFDVLDALQLVERDFRRTEANTTSTALAVPIPRHCRRTNASAALALCAVGFVSRWMIFSCSMIEAGHP
jgi:hypothetical protein